jgi:hypothetical protein
MTTRTVPRIAHPGIYLSKRFVELVYIAGYRYRCFLLENTGTSSTGERLDLVLSLLGRVWYACLYLLLLGSSKAVASWVQNYPSNWAERTKEGTEKS